MTQRTPTAEEVLKIYRRCLETGSCISEFTAAYLQWQASKGPVTREWFVERFGRHDMFLSVGWLKIDHDGDVLLDDVVLDNPTRSDIETLVRVLGGEVCT